MNKTTIALIAAMFSAAVFAGGCESNSSAKCGDAQLAGVQISDPEPTTAPATKPADEQTNDKVVIVRQSRPRGRFINIGELNPTETYEGLQYTIATSTQRPSIGQTIDVTLTATNISDQPITIPAEGRAPAYIYVCRYNGASWETSEKYPQAQVVLMNPWQIEPGQTKTFVLTIPVEPDWPTAETLMIVGELNGLPYQQAATPLRVFPSEYNEAK